jgi:hypothetical protein
MATCTSPEVAFLNPTGQERPETSCRWSSDYQQAMILASENVADLVAGVADSRGNLFCGGQLLLEKNRRENYFRPLDAKVICAVEGCCHRQLSGNLIGQLSKLAEVRFFRPAPFSPAEGYA